MVLQSSRKPFCCRFMQPCLAGSKPSPSLFIHSCFLLSNYSCWREREIHCENRTRLTVKIVFYKKVGYKAPRASRSGRDGISTQRRDANLRCLVLVSRRVFLLRYGPTELLFHAGPRGPRHEIYARPCIWTIFVRDIPGSSIRQTSTSNHVGSCSVLAMVRIIACIAFTCSAIGAGVLCLVPQLSSPRPSLLISMLILVLVLILGLSFL